MALKLFLLSISSYFFISKLANAFKSAQLNAQNFIHPGVLVSIDDITSAKSRLASSEEPTTSFFNQAIKNFDITYIPHGPPLNGTISCGYYDSPNIGCSEEDSDIDTAYILTLIFALNGNVSFATSARTIINLYSSGLKRYTNNTQGTCCGNEALQAAWVSAKITRAAELLRHLPNSGWTNEDTISFNNLMYTVHLPHLIGGTDANGNWMASFLEGMFGIAVFSENATLYNHALKAWTDRMPSYFYITSDGVLPPKNPQSGCSPNPVCEYYNQTIFDSRTNGVCQETCRDMGHMQMGLGAFVNGAKTATIQGNDLFVLQSSRFFAASEFAARLLLNSTPPSANLMCSGAPVKLATMPTFEILHGQFVRLGMNDILTTQWIKNSVRTLANPVGSQVSIFETLSHGLPIV
jgi:hypothetical protein